MRRILLIRDRQMGDVVLTTALLEDIRAAQPDAAIDFLVGERAAPLLRHHPLIEEVLILDKDRVTGMWREIRSRRYDLVIDPQTTVRTACIARASGAALRVGWRSRGRAWAYTHPVERERNRRYVVHDMQRLLHAVGMPTAALLPRLQLSEEERSEGAAALARLGIEPGSTVVGVMLTTREPARDWPISHFVRLSRDLEGAGVTTVIIPGGSDTARIAAFQAEGGRGLLAPNVGIRPLMALIAGCSLLVSPDTGPAHIATALGVSRVTLYGPSSPLGWSPGIDTTIALRSGGDAGGPMEDLQPELVIRAVLGVLGRDRSASRPLGQEGAR